MGNNNEDRISEDRVETSDNSRKDVIKNKISKQKGLKVTNKPKKQKQLINGPISVKLGIRKDGSRPDLGSKDAGSMFGLGRRSGRNSNGLILLDPKHHSVVTLKENRSPNEGTIVA